MNLGATLYVGNSLEAAEFYREAFQMDIGYNAKNPDGSYLHAELQKEGQSLFAVSEADDGAFRQAVLNAKQPTTSLGLNLDDDAQLKRAYEMIAKEGRVLRALGELPWSPCSADVVDKYGVCWYLYVSQHKPD